MPHILSIDTVSELCSAALWHSEDASPTYFRESSEKRSHARMLAPFCAELMDESGNRPEGVAIVAGPGSYTGLRIGASTAKGLAFSLDIPLFSVSTLHYLAHAVLGNLETDTIISMIPARQTEVFAAVFQVQDGILSRLTDDRPIELAHIHSLATDSMKSITCVSNTQSVLQAVSENYVDYAVVRATHDARHLKSLLKNRMDDFCVKDLHSFEPSYLKEFVAKKATRTLFERLPF